MIQVEMPREGEKILKIVSRSGMSSILSSLEKNPMRFSQLMFKTRLNPGILDRHLKSLIKFGIVEKDEEKYILTQKGERLIEVLRDLLSLYEV